jgi:DUF1680 family protein
VVEPDRRIDAVRGCLAIERGPLVYCLESADLPDDAELEEIELGPEARPEPVARPDLAAGLVGLTLAAVRRTAPQPGWPYPAVDGSRPAPVDKLTVGETTPLVVGSVPYLAWANRSVDGMRVWIPRRSEEPAPDDGSGG